MLACAVHWGTAWALTHAPCVLPAGLLLYLLDVTFRCAQQAQPVHVARAQPCRSATLATLHFEADPFTPIKPVQARCPACACAGPHCAYMGCITFLQIMGGV